MMSRIEASPDRASDLTESPAYPKPGKRAASSGNLSEGIDAERLQHAKKVVLEGIRHPETCMRLAFLIEKEKLKTTRKSNPDHVLANCQNKYILIGKENIIQLLLALEDKLVEEVLRFMKLEDLQELLTFALCLAEKCAVHSKNWSELVTNAQMRYNKVLGGIRLMAVVFVKRGDNRVFYYIVDYDRGGCYKLIHKNANPKSNFVAIEHVSGIRAPLKPQLEHTWKLSGNNDDRKAKLVQPGTVSEIPVMNIFEKCGLAQELPEQLWLERVGCTPPMTPRPKGRKPTLALCDKPNGNVAVASTSSSSSSGGTAIHVVDETNKVPEGRGRPKQMAAPPSKKTRRS